ncbi:Glycine betaine/carnitine transport binding protein GbuC precursor [compost metagenome]
MFRKTLKALTVLTIVGSLILSGCAKKEGEGTVVQGVGKQVSYKIIGIDPGAGIMQTTAEVLKAYDLKDWELVESSGAAMTAALDKAYKDKKPIIITGWTPHWMFAKYELKYLADPKGVYGGDEQIHTIVKKGLKAEAPSAYALLDRFEWTTEDMAKVMGDIQSGKKPEAAAEAWVQNNAAKVDTWMKDLTKDEGKKLKLAYVAWDSEIASTNVVKYVLEHHLGYKVDLLQVEAGPMWVGVSNGDVDAIVAAWLPTTHKDYYEKYKGNFEDLGPNLNGTRIGLVVPAYMDINSIEDLK